MFDMLLRLMNTLETPQPHTTSIQMKTKRSWLYNEFKQVGKDYSNPEEAGVYDTSHSDFRDFDEEHARIAETLSLDENHTLIDFGCGTANFAIYAARRCKKVIAVDVSTAMLDVAIKKASDAGVENIEFVHSGFLNYSHSGGEIDAAVTSLSFHHLPDFWKGITLNKIHNMLRHKGKLYLYDVILNDDEPMADIDTFIEQQAAAGGDFLREDAEMHFKEEFSTYAWILDGLLERAGFRVITKELDGVFGTYVCEKR